MSTHPKMQRPDQEKTDINFSAIGKIAIAFVVVGALLFAGVWSMFSYLRTQAERRDVRRSLVEAQPPVPPEPHLQVDSHKDLEEYLRTQRETLNSYGWVSRATGRVRIPIDR